MAVIKSDIAGNENHENSERELLIAESGNGKF
jgi:hypothetical protein